MMTKEEAIAFLNSQAWQGKPNAEQVAYHTRLCDAIFYDNRPLSEQEFRQRLNIAMV